MSEAQHWKAILVAVAAMVGILGAAFAVDLTHNTMAWRWVGFSPATVFALATYSLALSALGWAIKTIASRRSAIAIAALALLLLFVGLSGMREEHGSKAKPREPSPAVFRATRAAFLSLPFLLVSAGIVRGRRARRNGQSP